MIGEHAIGQNTFQLCAEKICGPGHTLTASLYLGGHGKDAFAVGRGDPLVLVVCDGTTYGSAEGEEFGLESRNELGALFGCQVLMQRLRRAYERCGMNADGAMWRRAAADLLIRLRLAAQAMAGGDLRDLPLRQREELVLEHFCFTAIAAVIDAATTEIAAIGDGFVAINGELKELTSVVKNEPDCIGSALLLDDKTAVPPEVAFQTVAHIPTADLQSLLLATDGLQYLIRNERRLVPGTQWELGPAAQLWEDEYFFNDPTSALRWLRGLCTTRSARVPGFAQRPVDTPLLHDDLAFISLRRKGGEADAAGSDLEQTGDNQ
jgi:hypothetical protein